MKVTTKKNGTDGAVGVVRDSARQIWLAGLGALSLAEDETGKLFKALVKRGRAYEATSGARLEQARKTFDVRSQAAIGNVTRKVASRLDDGLTQILHQVGMPTRKEIDALDKRVERLTKAIEHRNVRHPRRAARSSKSSKAPSATGALVS